MARLKWMHCFVFRTGQPPSGMLSTGTQDHPAWAYCTKQTAGRTRSTGEAIGGEVLTEQRINCGVNQDSQEEQGGRNQGLFAIIENLPPNQHGISPRASLRGTRCSPKIIQRANWNSKFEDSFSDSEPDEFLTIGRHNQQRRHSFKVTRTKRIDLDGYEPEDLSVCGTLDSSQSSISPDVSQLVHSRTEDWGMLHSMGKERRLSSVSVM